MTKKYNFTVIGGGLVGCLASIVLSKKNYSICLIEKKSFKTIIPDNFSPLSLTINTIDFLKKNRLWDDGIFKSSEINKLTIKLFNSFNVVKFTSDDLNGEKLGSIIDKSSFLSFLRDKCLKDQNIDIVDEIDLNLETNTSPFQISLIQTKSEIMSENLIVTDGANSQLAKKLNMKSLALSYKQTSFMLNVNFKSVSGGAFQVFTKKGIFAILPYNDNSVSIVASVYDDFIDDFNFESENANIQLLESELCPFIKGIHNPILLYKYPLNTTRLVTWTRQNIIFLGNSSQLLHPFGAQGFNFAVDCVKEIDNHSTELFIDNELSSDLIETINMKRNTVLNRIDFTSSALMKNNILANLSSSFFSKAMNSSATLRKSILKKLVGVN